MSEERYYEAATNWALDAQSEAGRSRRVAWTIASLAIAVAMFEAVALAMLAPLKSVQTVTVLVDKQTGYVQALDPSWPRRVLADDALTNAYLAQYVTAREGFDRATISGDYRKVALWSAGSARANYLASMPATNPASPFQQIPAGFTRQSTVKSVSRLGPGMALVRFDTAALDRAGQRSAIQSWVTVVRFRYVDAPMRLEGPVRQSARLPGHDLPSRRRGAVDCGRCRAGGAGASCDDHYCPSSPHRDTVSVSHRSSPCRAGPSDKVGDRAARRPLCNP